jgi:TonB family protein
MTRGMATLRSGLQASSWEVRVLSLRLPIALLLLGLCVALPAGAASPPTAQAVIVEPQLTGPVTPQWPKVVQDEGLRGDVLVDVDLDVQGHVTKVAVVKASGRPEIDAAAVQAARNLEFTPALQDGKPVPVRIRYRFQYAPEVRIDRRGFAPSLGRFDRRPQEDSPQGVSSLTGQVVERGTGRPVVGALVTVPALNAEAVSDNQGRFRFGLLAPGTWEVYLPGADHKPVRTRVTIERGRTATLTLRAERLSYTIYRATAEAPPEPGEMSRRSLQAEEIQKLPGANGDAFKVVQNLPGVARPTAGGGQIVVRGSAPGDTIVSVEGVRIPLIYHFGGIYSVLNTDLLESIDFYPGGYPVRYGRQTGGLVLARLAAPKYDAPWHGYAEANIFHAGVFLQGPLGPDTQLTLAGRRSYIDVLLSTFAGDRLPLTLAPRYYDYQARLDHRVSQRTDLSVFAFGSDDALSAVLKNPPSAFPQARGGIESSTRFLTTMAILRHRGERWTSTTTLGGVFSTIDASFAELFRFAVNSREYTARQDFTFGDGPIQIRTGLDILCNPFTAEVYAPAIGGTGERGTGTGGGGLGSSTFVHQDGLFVTPSAYFDTVMRLWPRLEVVPGLRMDLYRGASEGQSLTPRLNARFRWTDRLTLKASSGQTTQRPDPQYVSQGFGNPALLPFKSFETAVGFEYKLTDAIDVDLQGFNKQLSALVVQPVGAAFGVGLPFVNGGTGHVVGLELLARHRMTDRLFGWVAYTLQKATRIDHPGDIERPFGWDQTHILTALASYKLPRNWEIGARFRLVTGNPTTLPVTAVYDEKNDRYVRVNNACTLCDRLPAFHQLDVRIDKKWAFDHWLLNVYLDVQNVYNRQNAEGIQYNFDATQQAYQGGLPIIPSLGVRGEF